jgi:hypothetical protein
MDMDEPKLLLSSTDREKIDPTRAMPNKDTAEPSRTKARNDKDDPICRKSNTDNADPKRANVLRDSEDAMCA